MDLNAVLAKSKQVMDKTKNLPYGGYNEQAGTSVNNKNGDVMFEQRMSNNNNAPFFSESAASKSKLPKEVIEAMRKTSSSETSKNVQQRNPYEQINEQVQHQQQPVQQQGIDYSLIRMMIDESIKKYTSQLKKTIINESKEKNNGGLQMMTKQGNTFRFITEDGKIYEAKMTYKGNLNEK